MDQNPSGEGEKREKFIEKTSLTSCCTVRDSYTSFKYSLSHQGITYTRFRVIYKASYNVVRGAITVVSESRERKRERERCYILCYSVASRYYTKRRPAWCLYKYGEWACFSAESHTQVWINQSLAN